MLKNIKILLIEYLKEDADKIELELKNSDFSFKLERAASKDGFIRGIKNFKPNIILSEYHLPQFNALEGLSYLNQHKLKIPFIIVSNYKTEDDFITCIREGADDYILKSNLKRLSSSIISAIEKKRIEKEKERAVNALKANEEMYKLISENSHDLISVLNPSGKIEYVSPSFNKSLGFESNKLLGEKYFEFIHPADREAIVQLFFESKKKHQTFKAEYKFQNLLGKWCIVESFGEWVVQPDKRIVKAVIVSRDITERIKHEHEIIREKERAEEANRVKNEFLAILSQQIRDPLNVMLGYANLIKESNKKGEAANNSEYIEYIELAGENILKSINKILVLS